VRILKLRPAQHKSRFAHLPRVIGRALIAVVPAVLLVTFLVVHFSRHAVPNRGPVANIQFDLTTETPVEVSPAGLPSRPIFPYSVVPGGVRDAQELQKAAAADPVVAKHYSDFKIAKSRTIQLNSPVEMYVSYRRNNQVYWTKNKMMIPAGETLISDGENLARVRCGNRLSPVAAKPVAATDPAKEELDTPEFIPPMLANLLPGESVEMFPGGPIGGSSGPSTAAASKSGSPYTPILPPLLGPGISRTPHSTPVPPPLPPPLPPQLQPPVKTPEPGSLSLLLAGAGFMALLALITLRRNSSN
jgi:PEP-CTERM motif-containing protein